MVDDKSLCYVATKHTSATKSSECYLLVILVQVETSKVLQCTLI